MPEDIIGNEIGIDTETITYITERSQNIVRYSDKISEVLEVVDKYFEKIGPIAGIKFIDPEPFYVENDPYLGKTEYYLKVTKDWGLWARKWGEIPESTLITESPRHIKKFAIKRFPEFLRLYAEKLKELEKEYKDVAAKAELIAEVLGESE